MVTVAKLDGKVDEVGEMDRVRRKHCSVTHLIVLKGLLGALGTSLLLSEVRSWPSGLELPNFAGVRVRVRFSRVFSTLPPK